MCSTQPGVEPKLFTFNPRVVPTLVGRSDEFMTFFDLHPIDPYEARLKVVATLVLLSELGVVKRREAPAVSAGRSPSARPARPRQAARRESRLVRPPRSC